MPKFRRNDPPEVFGTSLIDLLVGGLTLVSILWVLNSLNSGYKGRGEVDTYSAFASVGQFGLNHIKFIRIEQDGEWFCECSVDSLDNMKCQQPCSVTSPSVGVTPIPMNNTNGVGISVISKDNKQLEHPLNAIIRILPEDAQFTGGVQFNVDNLDKKIKATITVDTCCHSSDPHYIRIVRIAPGIEEKDLLLWHQDTALQSVLTKRNINDSWIKDFQKSVRKYFNKRNIMAFSSTSVNCVNLPKIIELEFDEDDGINLNLPMTSSNTTNLRSIQKYFYHKLQDYSNNVTP